MKFKIALFILILNFSIQKSADYYWIGGSGNWSDISHWATASGGGTTHLVVPTNNDIIHFDAQSFLYQNCTVNVNTNAVCKDMIWSNITNNPTFAGNSNISLRIYGSLTLDKSINFTFQGMTYFESTTTGNKITSNGITLNNDIYFEGIGGEWILQDSLSLNGDIFLNNGTFNTNNQKVSCYSFNSNINTVRKLILGSSLFVVSSSYLNPSGWYVVSNNLTLDAGTSTIRITSMNASMTAGNALNYYNIEFKATTGTSDFWGSSTYNKVTFFGNGNINDDNTFNTLNFTSGKNYTILSGKNETITNEFNMSGLCTEPIFLQSSISGSSCTITKTGGDVTVNYTTLKDIHATGAAFTAKFSVDLGNNDGWNIISSSNQDLYWVGGTGNWSDYQHWSNQSGGTGGACIPTPIDNIFFDNNSFSDTSQSVTVNVSNASCNNMTWTSSTFTPTLACPKTNNLFIFGSMTFSDSMNLAYKGKIYFKSENPGRTIKTANHILNADLYFTGFAGDWTLLDNMNTTGEIFFNSGTLKTNDKVVICNSFNSNITNNRNLSLGSSTITINGEFTSNNAWSVASQSLIFSSGTSLIQIIDSNACLSPGNGLVYHDVEFLHPNSKNYIWGTSTFHKVTFKGNGKILDDNTYDSLILSSGKIYELEAAKTQTINSAFISSGLCTGPILLQSSIQGTTANIKKTIDSVIVDHVILKDIDAIGGAVFLANNSLDMGNNHGWTINSPIPLNLYWIGDSGNWDDPNHWSLTSGGTGGACIPTPSDNVYFNANSFSAPNANVFINTNAFCNSMDWSGAKFIPTLSGNDPLRIYGSLILNQNMNLKFTGKIYFESTSGVQNITTNGNKLNSDLYFQGINGDWTLQDNLDLNGVIFFYNGSLNTNSKTINCGSFYSDVMNKRKLILGSSIITASSSYYNNIGWNVFSDNMVLNSGKSIINITGMNAGMNAGQFLTYNFVNFLNQNGTSILHGSGAFKYVLFKSSAKIYDNNTFDTLTFSPGKTYEIEAGKTQTIASQLNIRGNNCFPITFRSTNAGQQGTLYKAGGYVSGDFIQIRDIFATGGVTYYAGIHSTNISNNSGWTFDNSPGYIYGLGPDTAICPGEVLKTFNFNGAKSYRWQDGSTDSIYTITQPGTYWVVASYADSCNYTDTINVSMRPTPNVFIGNDTLFCNPNAVLKFNPQVTGGTKPYASYSWDPPTGLDNPNILNPTARLDTSMTYVLTVMGANGCPGKDTIRVVVNPSFNLQLLDTKDTLAFPNICSGLQIDTTFEIKNLDVISTIVSIATTPNNLFSLDANPTVLFIAPNEIKKIHVHFKTASPDGLYYGILNIVNPCGKSKSLVLKGGIFVPDMKFQDTLNFGDVCLNSTIDTNFIFENKSSRMTYFNGIINSTSSFTFSQDSLRKNFDTNETRQINVSLITGNTDGVYIDSIQIYNICGGYKTMILKATAFNPSISSVNIIDFGRFCYDDLKDTIISINNLINYNSKFKFTVNDSTRFSTDKSSAVIPGNQQLPLRIKFLGYNQESVLYDTLNIIDQCNFINRIILKADIINPKFVADSTNIVIDSVDYGATLTKKLVFRNLGISSININNISPFVAPYKILSITPPLPITLNPNDSIEVEIEFTGIDDLVHNQPLWLSGNTPCNFSDTVFISGQGLPAMAKAIIYIPSDSAYAGETINLPLMLRSGQYILQSGITSFVARLRMNKWILKPILNTPLDSIAGDDRIIEIGGPVVDTIGKLIDIQYRAFLGDVDCSPVTIDTIIWNGGKRFAFKTENGTFCLKGICRKGGGTRLLNMTTPFILYDAKPNPATETVHFEFDANEETATELYLVDIIGRTTVPVFKDNIKAGTYSVDFDVSKLSEGVYFYILKTPSQMQSKILSIVK